MGRQPVSVGSRTDAAEYRNELLGRLGLQADASDQDIESAHDELAEFLEASPREMKSWAAARATEVDEAYALLSGPEEDLIPPPAQTPVTLQKTAEGTVPVPSSVPAPFAPAPAPVSPTAGKSRRNQLVGAIVALLVVAVVVGVYFAGKSEVPGISGAPTNNPSPTAAGEPTAAPVDQTKVAALTKKITSNPKDVASLQGLGDIYFASRDYKTAASWEQKILAVDPKNQVALLSIGAAQFNAGNKAEAKKNWLVAAKLYPKNAEVFYDLGFLYMSQTPPDIARMTVAWKKVVAIDPTSNLAKTVATHIKGAPAPSSSATSTPSAK